MAIRPLRLDDVAPCIHLGEEMLGDSIMATKGSIDREKSAFMLNRLVKDDRVYCWGAFDENEQPTALLIGVVEPHVFLDIIIAKDVVFYGRKDNSGAKGAIGLIQGFEAWAKVQGADIVFFEVSAGIADERVERLLNHFAYERTGVGLRKELH